MSSHVRKTLFGLLAAALPAVAHAQPKHSCDAALTVTATPSEWQTPFDRPITVHASDVPLREAIARVAAAADIRISYSTEALPRDRRVCLAYDDVPVGAALAALLGRAPVQAVIAGANHVVLAPVAAQPTREPEVAPAPVMKHEPVIAETSIHRSDAAASTHMTVIHGEELVRQGVQTVAQAMNGMVPGVWVWGPSSSGITTRYASFRGASSFRGSSPKIYLDGVELSNPLLLSRLSTDAIERIEVIRGPQGAALYGADAIAGVTNIITRHEVVPEGSARIRVHSGLGLASSDYTARSALSQDHAVSVRAGTLTRSLGINIAAGSLGEFAPDASARHLTGDLSARWLGSRATVTGTLRFLADRSASGHNPLLPDSLLEAQRLLGMAPSIAAQDVRQYTGGITAMYQPSSMWKHSLVVGVDGYSLDREAEFTAGAQSPAGPAAPISPSSGAQPPRQITGVVHVGAPDATADRQELSSVSGAWRGTLRASTVGTFVLDDVGSGTVTFSAEHSMLRQRLGSEELSRANTGVTAQTELALFERLRLSGGIRFEHDGGVANVLRTAALPMLGGSFLSSRGDVSVKLRTAYGKAIRWPQLPSFEDTRNTLRNAYYAFALGPEQQSGVEAGIDMHVGRAFTLQLTRFDQTATSLTQPVGITSTSMDDARRGYTSVQYEMQSVGQIDNEGWELQASLRHGRIALAGTASLVDSRVRSLSAGYVGDLRPGDRMLGVPARTASLTAAWTGERTFASITAARAADWINYDVLALANVPRPPTGAQLRSTWRMYGGVTQLRATVARELGRGLSFTLAGDNLLDIQVGEPDNITIVPGRTFSFGIRAAF